MFRLLIDTCVWLDLASDPKLNHLVGVVEELVNLGQIELIVPRVVIDEIQRNRERIEKNSVKSLTSHFRVVREAVKKAGGDEQKIKATLALLDDVNHKLPIIGGVAVNILDQVERLLSEAIIVEQSDAISLRSAKRALENKAPFHGGKNSMADAIIIETYAEQVNAKGNAGIKFAFITHNKDDFSEQTGNKNLPHADYDGLFTKVKSQYFINLSEALNKIAPSLVDEIVFERSWEEEPRGLAEILEAEHALTNQVWYNRHCNRQYQVDKGLINIVEKETYPKMPGAKETIQKDIWEGALNSAKRVEQLLGEENVGPWDDFEWGMLNGKLSAIRWMLGDEWDSLYT